MLNVISNIDNRRCCALSTSYASLHNANKSMESAACQTYDSYVENGV